MKIQPYLFFNGTCEAAFRFYEKALGGKIGELHRFKDMPPQEGAADDGCGGMSPEALAAMGEKVMHVNLVVGDQTIMGSDNPDDSKDGIHGVTITLGFTGCGGRPQGIRSAFGEGRRADAVWRDLLGQWFRHVQ